MRSVHFQYFRNCVWFFLLFIFPVVTFLEEENKSFNYWWVMRKTCTPNKILGEGCACWWVQREIDWLLDDTIAEMQPEADGKWAPTSWINLSRRLRDRWVAYTETVCGMLNYWQLLTFPKLNGCCKLVAGWSGDGGRSKTKTSACIKDKP